MDRNKLINLKLDIPIQEAEIILDDLLYAVELIKHNELEISDISWLYLLSKLPSIQKFPVTDMDLKKVNPFIQTHILAFILEVIWGSEDKEYYKFTKEIKIVLILLDWINEISEIEIIRSYNLSLFDFSNCICQISKYSKILQKICNEGKFLSFKPQIDILTIRLEKGIKPDLIYHTNLELFDRLKLRILLNEGIITQTDINKSNPELPLNCFSISSSQTNNSSSKDSSVQDDEHLSLFYQYVVELLQKKYPDLINPKKLPRVYRDSTIDSFGKNDDFIIIETDLDLILKIENKYKLEIDLDIDIQKIIPEKWKWSISNTKISSFSKVAEDESLDWENAEKKMKEWLDRRKYQFYRIDQFPESFAKVFQGTTKRADFHILDLKIYVDVKSKTFNPKYRNFTLNELEIIKYREWQTRSSEKVYFAFTLKDIDYLTWYWIALDEVLHFPIVNGNNGNFRSIPFESCIPIGEEKLENRLIDV